MINPVTILCVGNYLMGDEGVGVHFAKLLEQETLPDGVTLVEGGSGGFKLMEFIDQDASVIIIDASLDGNAPGSIKLIEPRFASDFPKAMSTHEIGLKDLVESLVLLGRMPKIYLFIVSIDSVQPLSVALSDGVSQCLSELKEKVIELATSLTKQKVVLST